ncbi:hypothetical protein HZC53_03200 [Candidatus Uhrbacteria bacterium]|nr:hypothetical protein [Candidatus Uhrbacteria bacterium]
MSRRGNSGSSGSSGKGSSGKGAPLGGPEISISSATTVAIPPGVEIWYDPGELPPPAFGRRAATNLVQGGLGGIGLGILWVTIVGGVFFFVLLAMYLGIIGVLWGLCAIVGA